MYLQAFLAVLRSHKLSLEATLQVFCQRSLQKLLSFCVMLSFIVVSPSALLFAAEVASCG